MRRRDPRAALPQRERHETIGFVLAKLRGAAGTHVVRDVAAVGAAVEILAVVAQDPRAGERAPATRRAPLAHTRDDREPFERAHGQSPDGPLGSFAVTVIVVDFESRPDRSSHASSILSPSRLSVHPTGTAMQLPEA